MKETIDDSSNNLLEEKLAEISKLISSVWQRIPEDERPKERKPTILICGMVGVGKSTTINTLFGESVANVGYFSRGSHTDIIYEWESESENINVIDLPGLGDGSAKDEKEFRQIYKKRIKEADAIILVSTPPRPASTGTIRTINLLLSEGVRSSHIVFGLNKLGDMRYPNPINNSLMQVNIDGLIGPTKESDIKAIEEQKKHFLNDLNTYVKNGKFSIDQIIEFDSLSGWNLHKMLFACVDRLPFVVSRQFRLATLESEREIKRREIEKYENEKKRLEEMVKEKDMIIRETEADSKLQQAKATYYIIEEKLKNKELKEGKKKEKKEEYKKLPPSTIQLPSSNSSPDFSSLSDVNKKRGEAIIDFERNKNKFEQTVTTKILEGIAKVVDKVDKNTAQLIRGTAKVIDDVYSIAKEPVKKAWNWVKSWF